MKYTASSFRLQIVIVDRDEIVAGFDLQVIVIGGAILVDVADLVEPGCIGNDIESRVASLRRFALIARRTAAGDAGVRALS